MCQNLSKETPERSVEPLFSQHFATNPSKNYHILSCVKETPQRSEGPSEWAPQRSVGPLFSQQFYLFVYNMDREMDGLSSMMKVSKTKYRVNQQASLG